jgi:ubiquinone/menaquinone biosynthesis C-methylase UbiE
MSEDKTPYIIQGGQRGADRLRLLANVMWQYTEPFLHRAGLREGMRCLDVGCANGALTRRITDIVGPTSHVTGFDFDESVIAIAEKESTDYANVNFQVFNIENEIPEAARYDFIFCRFILSHLQSPGAAIRKLKGALRPNGIIAIEDVDFRGHFSHPASPAYDAYVRWYTELGLRKGGNPLLGPFILSIVKAEGLDPIQFNVETPVFSEGDGKRMALLTLQAIRDTVIAEKLASAADIDAVIRDLDSLTRDENSIISMPRIFQVAGGKSDNGTLGPGYSVS